MSEREELEAVIDGLRAAQKRLYDDAEPHEGGRPFGAMVRGADAMGEAARKLKTLSGYTKGNGELVEAVRLCLAYFEVMNVTGSLPDQCRKALSGRFGAGSDVLAKRGADPDESLSLAIERIGSFSAHLDEGGGYNRENVFEMVRHSERVISALFELERAARSESEDTQAKPTPTQADVDALVEAALDLRRGMTGHYVSAQDLYVFDGRLEPFQKG